MLNPYITHLLILICIYSILAVSLNIALGYTGLFNLGHVAFFGIGAYTSALIMKAGLPFILAFVAAGTLSSFFGFLLVYATKKLKGDYLALATLAFTYVTYSVFVNWKSVTRGPLGIAGIARPSFLGYTLRSNEAYLVFAALLTIMCVVIMWRIVKSPFGKLLEAVRDDELGLRVLGKNTSMLKYKAMGISAFFAGLAGSIFAHYISFIDPASFMLTELILILTILIAGGIASIHGSIVASVVIILIPEMLRFLALPASVLGPMRQILYALILLAILLYRPRGLFGRVDLHA